MEANAIIRRMAWRERETMKRRIVLAIVAVAAVATVAQVACEGAPINFSLFAQAGAPAKPDYPIKPVSFTAVHLNDEFWAPRIEINRTASIPSAFEQCELTGRVKLFERAAAVLRGEKNVDTRPPGYPFDETDLYKVIEGASYSLSVTSDPKLDAYVDGLIAKIAAAQEPDGYIYTTRTIDPKNPHRWAGPERWVFERDDSHELYDLGHLFEAAVAHIWPPASARCWTSRSRPPICSSPRSDPASARSGPAIRSPRWRS